MFYKIPAWIQGMGVEDEKAMSNRRRQDSSDPAQEPDSIKSATEWTDNSG